MKQKVESRILDRVFFGDSHYKLVLGNPFRSEILPGQFIMLSVSELGDPFLKRPLSISRALGRKEAGPDGEIHLLVKIVGKGTAQLAKLPVGTAVEMIGPLGKPFSIPEGLGQALFVAGGIGVAPFVELAACESLRSVDKLALIGGRSLDDILAVDELEACGTRVYTATEDGSSGLQGLVTDLLEARIDKGLIEPCQIYCCGPDAMMKAVSHIAAKHGIACQLSLEATMGCGIGVCLGCIVEMRNGEYARVCKEGPVFDAEELAEFGSDEKGGKL